MNGILVVLLATFKTNIRSSLHDCATSVTNCIGVSILPNTTIIALVLVWYCLQGYMVGRRLGMRCSDGCWKAEQRGRFDTIRMGPRNLSINNCRVSSLSSLRFARTPKGGRLISQLDAGAPENGHQYCDVDWIIIRTLSDSPTPTNDVCLTRVFDTCHDSDDNARPGQLSKQGSNRTDTTLVPPLSSSFLRCANRRRVGRLVGGTVVTCFL
ncbi:unnamed protein product [Brugia pahangi]|uniref:Uncharacterized protein n=1 Tax=Brugia pahangi TaxID=6280 RepID=A0A0N4T1L7_BRUPA|nr:unnamed protein product [Brugia pahangi]